MTTEEILKQSVDLDKLLSELDFAEVNLATATLKQGRLFLQAARYYVKKYRARVRAESAYEERKATLGQIIRKKETTRREQSKTKVKEMTEGELKEKLRLSPSVKELARAYDEAKVHEKFAELLLEAYRERRAACRILSGVLTDEARSDLRILTERKARQNLDKAIQRKYPRGQEE